MDEFSNRVDAQRVVLAIVNKRNWREELFGLTRAAISRWTTSNHLEPSSPMVELLVQISSKLNFLANKSQEHVTDEYKALCDDVNGMAQTLKDLVSTG